MNILTNIWAWFALGFLCGIVFTLGCDWIYEIWNERNKDHMDNFPGMGF